MESILSNQDRSVAVRNFMHAKFQGNVKITSFSPLTEHIEKKRVELLYELEKSGKKYAEYTSYVIGYYYTNEDAETYFDWLIAVITGVKKVSKDVIGKAIDQLFFFIYLLRDDMVFKQHIELVMPYEWEDKLSTFEKKLTNIHNRLDKRDKDITDILGKINNWMQYYGAVLDEIKKEQKQLKKVRKNE